MAGKDYVAALIPIAYIAVIRARLIDPLVVSNSTSIQRMVICSHLIAFHLTVQFSKVSSSATAQPFGLNTPSVQSFCPTRLSKYLHPSGVEKGKLRLVINEQHSPQRLHSSSFTSQYPLL
jgi:hypothetical protein